MTVGAFVEKLGLAIRLTEAAPRTLKVGRMFPTSGRNRSMGPVPFIRLAGKCLLELGFREGDTVDVVLSPGEIRLVYREGNPPQVNGQPELFKR